MNDKQEKVNVEDNNQYIDTIKQLKENSVSKDVYEKLKAENKKLLDSVINGSGEDDDSAKSEVKVQSIDELRNDLFNKDNSNLDFTTKALELRQRLIDAGEPDPFLPYGNKISPTNEDVATAEKVAKVLQECVEYAEGDSGVFTNELQRRTKDVKYK